MVSKVSIVALIAFVVLGIAIARVPSEWVIVGLAGFVGLIFLVYLFAILNWAKNNPELAATEGATFVQSRQLEMAAKGLPAPPSTAVVPDPQNPTLLIEDNGA